MRAYKDDSIEHNMYLRFIHMQYDVISILL